MLKKISNRMSNLKSILIRGLALMLVFIFSMPVCQAYAASRYTADQFRSVDTVIIANYLSGSEIIKWAKQYNFPYAIDADNTSGEYQILVYPQGSAVIGGYAKEGAKEGAKSGAKDGAKSGFIDGVEKAGQEGKGLGGQLWAGILGALGGAAKGAASGAVSGAVNGAATGILIGGTEYELGLTDAPEILYCYHINQNDVCWLVETLVNRNGVLSADQMYNYLETTLPRVKKLENPKVNCHVYYSSDDEAYMIGPDESVDENYYAVYSFPCYNKNSANIIFNLLN